MADAIKRRGIDYVSGMGVWHVLNQRAWIGGAAITLGGVLAAADRAVFGLTNSSSTHLVVVSKLSMTSTIDQIVRYNTGGTYTSAGTVTPRNHWVDSAETCPASMDYSTTGGVTGGTNWDNQTPVLANQRTEIDLSDAPVILTPGKKLIVYGNANASQTFTANAYFFGVPL